MLLKVSLCLPGLPSPMAKRTANAPLEINTHGASLTDFAQAICLQEQLEVGLVRLYVTVQQLTFPLCLVAASGLRPLVRPRLGDIPAWPLRQVPSLLAQCSVDMPSGLTLWPFSDDPHITQEGFILHGSNSEIRAKVYRFLLQREIPSNVAPSVREYLEWQYENGSPVQIFNFQSLEHLTLQAAPPPAKRRAANLISPQPTSSPVQPPPPTFRIFQEDPARQQGVYASQSARPPYSAARINPQSHGQEVLPHQLPFPSLIQDAARRVSAIKEAALTLLDIVQNNPLANNNHAHQSGARACHTICTEMETLEDALWQIP